MRTPFSVASLLAPLVLACSTPCGSTVPPSLQGTLRGVPSVYGPENVDLLLVIDNSSSMADKQLALVNAVGSLIDALANPPVDPATRRPRFAAMKSAHVGVVSTDLGTPGSTVATCSANSDGDDGLLNPIRNGLSLRSHPPWTTAPPGRRPPRCTNDPNQFPSFLRFDRMVAEPEDFAASVICNAYLSTGGCGLEQPLEAAYRALVVHDPRMTAGNADPNAGFVRDNAVLGIVVVTDEEDGSVRDCRFAERGVPCADALSVFDVTSPQWSSRDLNLRFYTYVPGSAQDPTWPLDRYIDPSNPRRGFTSLKPGRPEHVVFAAIAGVPRALPMRMANGDRTVDWDALLGRAPDGSDAYEGTTPEGPVSMQRRNLDPTCPARVVPACRRQAATPAGECEPAASDVALPSRRIAEVARRFDERYRNGVVRSICDDDLRDALAQVAFRIQRRLGGSCLGADLPTAPAACEPGSGQQGCIQARCVVSEILPAGASAASACAADRGRAPGEREAQLQRDTCLVRQIAVPPGGAPTANAPGFYYDTRPDGELLQCQRRVTFTDAFAMTPGAVYVLQCIQVSSGSGTASPSTCAE